MSVTPPPSTIAGRYRVVRELGRGGMGVVYLVEHVHTGDHLALKVLLGRGSTQPEIVERFKREARASARIKSENVVKVVDADVAPELDGAPFLVMELLEGKDLKALLDQNTRLPKQQVFQLLTQAARALDKSHAIGIIHRDLKPENLFLHEREDGTAVVKILDFGISKVVARDGITDLSGAGMTDTGVVLGTPFYMSPEQARGRTTEIGPPTDVWAMGLIALQLLTGEIYWRANTIAELMVQILSDPMYPPTTRWTWLPPGIDEWFLRSCAREGTSRFAQVGEQIEALGQALGLTGPPPSQLGGATVQLHAPMQATQHLTPSMIQSGQPSMPPYSSPHIANAQTTGGALARSEHTVKKSSGAPAAIAAAVVIGLGLLVTAGVVLKNTLHPKRPAVASGEAGNAPSTGAVDTLPAASVASAAALAPAPAPSPIASASGPTVLVAPRPAPRPPAFVTTRPATPASAADTKPFSPTGL